MTNVFMMSQISASLCQHLVTMLIECLHLTLRKRAQVDRARGLRLISITAPYTNVL